MSLLQHVRNKTKVLTPSQTILVDLPNWHKICQSGSLKIKIRKKGNVAAVQKLCLNVTSQRCVRASAKRTSAPTGKRRVLVAKVAVKVARNEVENASFAQRSAHRDSRIWRPELIEPAAERKRRARGRRQTFKSAYPDPQILPQSNISSNYPL